jgi:hypothetical protein
MVDIHGLVDADWVGDLDHKRSTSGYVFNLFGGDNQLDEQKTECSGTLNYRSLIHGSHSCKQGSNMVTEIVFRYWVGTTISEIRL